MRTFSLIASVVFLLVCGYLLFHVPAERSGVLDAFAATNVEAALSAVNGWIIAGTIFVAARSILYFVVGVLVNLARTEFKQAGILAAILIAKPLIAWLVYLGLFTYSRDIGFTRILWNLQDLFGASVDSWAVIAVGAVSLFCVAIVPDLIVGLVFGTQEQVLVQKAKPVKERPVADNSVEKVATN
jgi:hypothetical protein